jgi:hypothetical protein
VTTFIAFSRLGHQPIPVVGRSRGWRAPKLDVPGPIYDKNVLPIEPTTAIIEGSHTNRGSIVNLCRLIFHLPRSTYFTASGFGEGSHIGAR